MIMCWLTRVATLLNSGCMLCASIRVTVIRPGIHKSAYVWRFVALAELLLPSMLSSWCSSRSILPHDVAPCVRPTLLLMWYWSLLVLLLSMLLLMWYEQGIELFRGLFCPSSDDVLVWLQWGQSVFAVGMTRCHFASPARLWTSRGFNPHHRKGWLWCTLISGSS